MVGADPDEAASVGVYEVLQEPELRLHEAAEKVPSPLVPHEIVPVGEPIPSTVAVQAEAEPTSTYGGTQLTETESEGVTSPIATDGMMPNGGYERSLTQLKGPIVD